MIFGLFKAIWPEIKAQLEIKSAQKKKENELRAADQQLTREMIEQVKVTNGLVAKNNEAFSNHITVFGLHVEAIKDLKEHQRGLKVDMHKRFDRVEDRLETHHANAVKIETEQSEIVAGLRNHYGIGKTKEAQQ